jgi:hypothetical protein
MLVAAFVTVFLPMIAVLLLVASMVAVTMFTIVLVVAVLMRMIVWTIVLAMLTLARAVRVMNVAGYWALQMVSPAHQRSPFRNRT